MEKRGGKDSGEKPVELNPFEQAAESLNASMKFGGVYDPDNLRSAIGDVTVLLSDGLSAGDTEALAKRFKTVADLIKNAASFADENFDSFTANGLRVSSQSYEGVAAILVPVKVEAVPQVPQPSQMGLAKR